MPELPEIETLSRQLQPITDTVITSVEYASVKLRDLLDDSLLNIQYKKILKIYRRAKYLVIKLTEGYLIIHLGMSGRLLLVNVDTPLKKHDHVSIYLNDGQILRYNDPRRFGCVIYRDNLSCLSNLAKEPFDESFNAEYLYQQCLKKITNIKTVILNGQVVVGVGNIYVSESLFLAKIHPLRPAKTLSLQECTLLVKIILQVLSLAINNKGSSLKNFVNIGGEQGHATNNHLVYGKENNACVNKCGATITTTRIAGRNTFYCPTCQI